MEAAATYDFFGERYGWTPDEVDAQPAWLRDRLPTVAALKNEIERERIKEGKG